MPPAKKRTRKAAKKTTGRAAKTGTNRPATRELSSAHKQALAEGRTMAAVVDRYLAAINLPKKRGRKVSMAKLNQRLADARGRVKTASGVDKVLAAQEVRDLQARLTAAGGGDAVDVKSLEAAFVKVARTFGETRGIRYGSWRDAGVSPDVLRRAGVPRTRG